MNLRNRLKSRVKSMIYKKAPLKVLMFHHVTTCPAIPRSGCMLSTEHFKKVIESFNNFVSYDDFFKTDNKPKVLLTFDDGLKDLFDIAYPYLRSKNIPFTIFIVENFIDKEGYLTSGEIELLKNDQLVTIGSHGVSHDILSGASMEQKLIEIDKSKEYFRNEFDFAIKTYAYSHGNFDQECIEQLKKSGYDSAFTVRGLPQKDYTGNRKFKIPRINVEEKSLKDVLEISAKN